MTYQVVYDILDEDAWFLLDSALLATLGGLIAMLFAAFAIHGRTGAPADYDSGRTEARMVRLGAVGFMIFGGLTCWWIVKYLLGGPVPSPLGRLIWFALSVMLLLAGKDQQVLTRGSSIGFLARLGLVIGAVAVTIATIVWSYQQWSAFAIQKELGQRDGFVVEGKVSETEPQKHFFRFKVGDTTFRLPPASYFGHLGRRIRIQNELRVRIRHDTGTILRFEVQSD